MNNNTILLRQIHPAFVQQGRVTSQAFRPTPKDQNRLSVYDGDQITAYNAFEHYTQQLGNNSIGILAVTIAECNDVQLPVQPDPEPFPEHAVIEFADLGKRDIEKRAKQLRIKAELRGWLFQAI
ncbi:MAG: hypothetical protein PHT25_09900 [Bacteroidales bacterium]|nr:hypothetical protein [Bacteroidales bacterium]